jgi:hypothetical protein
MAQSDERGPIEMILPPASDVLWGLLVFLLLGVLVIAGVVFMVRRTSRQGDREDLRERAVRAEAERDLLRDELDRLRRE